MQKFSSQLTYIISYKTQGIRPQQLWNNDGVSSLHCTATKSQIVVREADTQQAYKVTVRSSISYRI